MSMPGINVPLISGGINFDFVSNPRFVDAYMGGYSTLSSLGERAKYFVYDAWRVRIALWAAEHATRLPGDFVECGVNSGFLSKAIVQYLGFQNLKDKNFFLIDTFKGVPNDQFSSEEKQLGMDARAREYYSQDIFELCKENFRPYSNVFIVKGRVPEILGSLAVTRVSYLPIDMNCAEPEVAAVRFFWEKLVPSGVILFDDYGFSDHINQKNAVDTLALSLGTPVLQLPSGQAVIIKR